MMKPKDIAQSVIIAYFFVHGSIFYLLQHFGGVPISDHVLTVSDGVLQAPRNSRYEVAAFIMSGLIKRLKHLPKETETGRKQRKSKGEAQSLLARVLFMRLRGKSMFLLSIMI